MARLTTNRSSSPEPFGPSQTQPRTRKFLRLHPALTNPRGKFNPALDEVAQRHWQAAGSWAAALWLAVLTDS
jgi:hypothetical protein